MFHHTLSVLLHYLVKCKSLKMTQNVQKLQQNRSVLKFLTGGNVVGLTIINVTTEFA